MCFFFWLFDCQHFRAACFSRDQVLVILDELEELTLAIGSCAELARRELTQLVLRVATRFVRVELCDCAEQISAGFAVVAATGSEQDCQSVPRPLFA